MGMIDKGDATNLGQIDGDQPADKIPPTSPKMLNRFRFRTYRRYIEMSQEVT